MSNSKNQAHSLSHCQVEDIRQAVENLGKLQSDFNLQAMPTPYYGHKKYSLLQ